MLCLLEQIKYMTITCGFTDVASTNFPQLLEVLLSILYEDFEEILICMF